MKATTWDLDELHRELARQNTVSRIRKQLADTLAHNPPTMWQGIRREVNALMVSVAFLTVGLIGLAAGLYIITGMGILLGVGFGGQSVIGIVREARKVRKHPETVSTAVRLFRNTRERTQLVADLYDYARGEGARHGAAGDPAQLMGRIAHVLWLHPAVDDADAEPFLRSLNRAMNPAPSPRTDGPLVTPGSFDGTDREKLHEAVHRLESGATV